MVRVSFPGVGRTWRLLVAAETRPVWELFVAVMDKHDYKFRETAGGTYNCRRILASILWSLHAYGLALDLNPSTNPRRRPLRYDYPPGFIKDILSITVGGKQAFKWGGSWLRPDAMHWQLNLLPSDIPESEIMAAIQVIDLQKTLNKAGRTDHEGKRLAEDDDYGPRTASAWTKALAAEAGPDGHSHSIPASRTGV